MAFNGFTLGRNVTINIDSPSVALTLSPEEVLSIDLKSDATDKKFVTLGGPQHVIIDQGLSGTISIQRKDSTVEDYWAAFESLYYNNVNIVGATLTLTVAEANGTDSQYVLSDVVIRVDSLGTFSGDETVTQTLMFSAARFAKVA